MAEFMNQIKMMRVHRLSSSIYDCFLTRAASMGMNPALNLEADSGGSGSNCLMSCGSVHRHAVGLLLMWMMIFLVLHQ
jgi:hypothetical protein